MDALEELRRTIRPPREPSPCETEPFRIDTILIWADIEHSFPGSKWPTRRSGRVVGAPALTWNRIDRALRKGLVDDPEFVKGRSLAWFLRKCRGAPCRTLMPDLKPSWIMRWAVEHCGVEEGEVECAARCTGRSRWSGRAPAAAGKTAE